MAGRRHLATEMGQILKKEKQVPRMWRDHDEQALAAQHAAHRGERGFPIRKMLERTDEQDQVKMFAAMIAEADRLVRAKPELADLSDPLGPFDHRPADIHPDAVVDHGRELG